MNATADSKKVEKKCQNGENIYTDNVVMNFLALYFQYVKTRLLFDI